MEKLAIGSDHAGFELKEKIKSILEGMGLGWEDMGTNSTDSCDYPEYARAVADAVSGEKFKRGIICCGSGIGVSIVANKVRGIRAALCHDAVDAETSRQHNDSNVLCLAGRRTSVEESEKIIKTWLETPFEGGRHQRRVDMIEKPRAGE
ncbi:MAG: ribose 5-phosphate isomerase B [Cyanobacteria bacterium SZAS LIN-5]|nr:ribose 5-phosphate isomerase B [Cyanobacteria bacterium SZAS LIN-5]